MDYITQACYYTDLHFDSIVTAPKWGGLHKSCHPARSQELESVMIKLTMIIDFFFFFLTIDYGCLIRKLQGNTR